MEPEDLEPELLHEWECTSCGKGCSRDHGAFYCKKLDEWCCTECGSPVLEAEVI
jgi:hypothetical protein